MVALTVPMVAVFALRGAGEGTEVLMMRRTAPPVGTWAQVAGGIAPGEAAWQAATRSLHEGTGLVPDSLWTADAHEMFYEAEPDAITVAPCFVALVPPAAEPVLDGAHDAHVWAPFDVAERLVSFGGQRRVLRAIHEDFVMHAPHPTQRIAL